MHRTRAIEILEAAGLPYELGEFAAVDFTAEEVSEKLALPLSMVFKTLVVKGEKGGEAMAVIPGDKELSLKKMAAALGEKRAELIKLNDLQRITGYLKGGCSPLGSKKPVSVFLDESAILHERISVSAGLRGLQLLLTAETLERACGVRLVDLVE